MKISKKKKVFRHCILRIKIKVGLVIESKQYATMDKLVPLCKYGGYMADAKLLHDNLDEVKCPECNDKLLHMVTKSL